MRIEGGQTPPGPEGSNGSLTLFVAHPWRHPLAQTVEWSAKGRSLACEGALVGPRKRVFNTNAGRLRDKRGRSALEVVPKAEEAHGCEAVSFLLSYPLFLSRCSNSPRLPAVQIFSERLAVCRGFTFLPFSKLTLLFPRRAPRGAPTPHVQTPLNQPHPPDRDRRQLLPS